MSIILPDGVKAQRALTVEEQEQIAKLAEKVPEEETYPAVRAAFAVIIGMDGTVSIDPTLVKNVRPDREPTNEDVIGALAAVQSEIASTLTAIKTAQVMAQQAMAMQQQMQQQAQFASIQQGLAKGGR